MCLSHVVPSPLVLCSVPGVLLRGTDVSHTLAEGKGKAAATEKEEGSSVLDDDTLKCAICFDLCVRPVTVSLLCLAHSCRSMLCWDGACCRGLAPVGSAPAISRLQLYLAGHFVLAHACAISSAPSHGVALSCPAGPLPAQLLPEVLPGGGCRIGAVLPSMFVVGCGACTACCA